MEDASGTTGTRRRSNGDRMPGANIARRLPARESAPFMERDTTRRGASPAPRRARARAAEKHSASETGEQPPSASRIVADMITSIRPSHARRIPAAGALPGAPAGNVDVLELARVRAAAWCCIGGTTGFVMLLTGLHFLEPQLDPSWRFISEYAIGPFGWIMSLAFFFLVAAYVALFIAARPFVRTISDRIGLGFVLVSAIGLAIGGAFPADPITAAPGAATTAGKLHNVGGFLGMAMPFAAVLVSRTLARHPVWTWARRRLTWSAGLACAGFLIALVSLGVMLTRSGGAYGPNVPVGLPNRVEIAGYCIWLLVIGATLRSRTRNGS